jgi:alpha 1,2-mannosyltransferase
VAIKALRRTGCDLPIEVWYVGNELSEETISALEGLGAECRDFLDYPAGPRLGYRLKPFAILNSRFKEVLYLDADNICVKDPEELFETKEYAEHGALFWPDFWRTPKENPIWAITGSEAFGMKEQESGQIVIDKQRCWRELNLCQYFNVRSDIYYQLLLGDKDTFRFAWMALKTPFHMITTELGSCGFMDAGSRTFYGITMVQHDPAGEICFLHRNLLKWDITRPHEMVWEKIKRFLPDARRKEYYIETEHRNGHLYTDLQGDVEEIDFRQVLGDVEGRCMEDLEELRGSGMYTRFISHFYFANRRYPRHVRFELYHPVSIV